MPLDQQRGYYVIFSSIPAGGMQIITDCPSPSPPGPPTTTNFRNWVLPASLPRKFAITRAIVIYESNGYNTLLQLLTNPFASVDSVWDIREYFYRALNSAKWLASRTSMEAMLWVDPGGRHFNNANPPGAENSDYSDLNVVMHKFDPNPMFNFDTGPLPDPIIFDRENGDKLAFQVNNSDALNWAAISLSLRV